MVNEKLARRYAQAIFSLAGETGNVDATGDDLATIASAFDRDPVAADFFVAPVIARHVKERVLGDAFGSRVGDLALHALLLLVRKHRESLLGAVVAEYRKLQRATRGEEALTITSARPLPGTELTALVERLERIYGKKFDVTQVVDPETIGGVRLLMGDRRIDGTVSGRLEHLSRTLFATP
jgi:F-type H+-transporting ATPase subunit delta